MSSPHPWNAHQQRDRFLIGLQIALELSDCLIQKAEVGQQVGKQELVMGIDPSEQGFTQLRDLFMQRAPRGTVRPG